MAIGKIYESLNHLLKKTILHIGDI